MSGEAILFYGMSAIVLTFACLCVFTRRIFRAAVYLLGTLIGVAGIYLLMDMNFVAALQIMIYVGGIVVLIIFSIFLTHNTGRRLPLQKRSLRIVSLTLPLIAFFLVLYVLLQHPFASDYITVASSLDVKEIGMQLFDYKTKGYIFPFEMVSILLLAALVGSIVIAQKSK
jgi:NADH-quinone oxidoreductase subunit J